MLVLHVSNALQYTSPNSITQILRRRLRMNIPQIHRPVHPLHSIRSRAHTINRCVRALGERAERRKRILRGQGRGGLGNERLRGGSLGLLGGGLL